jgi:serine protease Do
MKYRSWTAKLLRAALLLAVALCPSMSSAQQADALLVLNRSVESLLRRVSPSVVQIKVTSFGRIEDDDEAGYVMGRQRSLGSGFVIDGDGYIMTNAHVVRDAQRIQVILPSPDMGRSLEAALTTRTRTLPAQIVGVAKDIDLALLKVDAKKLPVLPLAPYQGLRQGELVFALGSPEGLQNSVTMGVVSAIARQIDADSVLAYIQTDASINPGNSGGPLVNVKGEVVGVNTFILSESGGNEGLGFAIPSAVVAAAYRQLKTLGRIRKIDLGISLQTITPALAVGLKLPQDHGVLVSDVAPSGPADGAGVRIQDILLGVDGKAVESMPAVGFCLLTHDDRDKVVLKVLRDKKRLTITVPVPEQSGVMDKVGSLTNPEKNLIAPLGIVGVAVDEKLRAQNHDLRFPHGIVVAARSANASEEVPLVTGDVILSVNGSPVATLDGLRAAVGKLAKDQPIVVQVQREQQLTFLTFYLEPAAP